MYKSFSFITIALMAVVLMGASCEVPNLGTVNIDSERLDDAIEQAQERLKEGEEAGDEHMNERGMDSEEREEMQEENRERAENRSENGRDDEVRKQDSDRDQEQDREQEHRDDEEEDEENEEETSLHEINVVARQFEFEPSEIRVEKGDRIRMTLTSEDVTHGFNLPQFGVSKTIKPGEETTVEFVADTQGEFNFRCNVYCGAGHSEMDGVLIVE